MPPHKKIHLDINILSIVAMFLSYQNKMDEETWIHVDASCITKYQYQFDALYGQFVDLQLVNSAQSQKCCKSGLNTMTFN